MISAYDLTLWVYNLTIIPVIFFSVLFIVLSAINLFVDRGPKQRWAMPKKLPFISVQIPTFNDPIAARCVEKCLKFDYPKNKYEILIVDDSTSLETQNLLKKYANKHKIVKFIHRDNRNGFKPGALKDAMKHTKGEILVIFDADWIPKKDFLKKIVRPFSDPTVAIVQSRQGFYNHKTNLISRFAAYVLMAYHSIIMPINQKINSVFFCGTAGAIRRKHFDEVGGWNTMSITEDAELSVNLLLKGYKNVYLDFETPSEVPDTFEAFIKQQMRWCYGNTRVFFDNAKRIMFGKGLSLKQRAMISYITLGNFIAPVIVMMTFFGLSGWFLGEPTLFNWGDIVEFFSRFAVTIGFIAMGIVTLAKRRKLNEFWPMLASVFTIGIVIAVANSYAFFKAVSGRPLHWYCTPKRANENAS
ncbi:glycosyltransferase [Candidatus Woesearchaeota archaeon]|nr:glycosyltransferase [Candidatus Woesearchaeota archaeon]